MMSIHFGIWEEDFAANGIINVKLNHKCIEVRKCLGVLKNLWKKKCFNGDQTRHV